MKIASIRELLDLLSNTALILEGIPTFTMDEVIKNSTGKGRTGLDFETITKISDKFSYVYEEDFTSANSNSTGTDIEHDDSEDADASPEESIGNEGGKEAKIKYIIVDDMVYDLTLIRNINSAANRDNVCSSLRFHCAIVERDSNTNSDNGITIISENINGNLRAILAKYKELMNYLVLNLRGVSYFGKTEEYINNKVYLELKEAGLDVDTLDRVHPFTAVGDKSIDLSTYAVYTRGSVDGNEANFPNAFKTKLGSDKMKKVWSVKKEGIDLTVCRDNTRFFPAKINISSRNARDVTDLLDRVREIQLALVYCIACLHDKNSKYNEKALMTYLTDAVNSFYEKEFVMDTFEMESSLGVVYDDLIKARKDVSELSIKERAVMNRM